MLRRGFSLEPGERVLVVEDVVTTGGRLARRSTSRERQARPWSGRQHHRPQRWSAEPGRPFSRASHGFFAHVSARVLSALRGGPTCGEAGLARLNGGRRVAPSPTPTQEPELVGCCESDAGRQHRRDTANFKLTLAHDGTRFVGWQPGRGGIHSRSARGGARPLRGLARDRAWRGAHGRRCHALGQVASVVVSFDHDVTRCSGRSTRSFPRCQGAVDCRG